MERLKNADNILCLDDNASDILFYDVLSALDELYQWRLKWNLLHGGATAVAEENPGHAVTEIDTRLLPAPTSVKRFGNLQSAAELCLFNAIVLILLRIGETLRNRLRTAGFLKWSQELFASRFGSSQYLSEEIAQLAPYMSEVQHGNKGIYLLSFPLQIARSRLEPGSDVLKWAEDTMRSMNDNLGVYVSDDI
ncbi:hypothetical protein ZTR_10122 [Talaromyces verruculosus]|nr:hypothetical protein ZTR_10122 [Talaromyces verruculosus]